VYRSKVFRWFILWLAAMVALVIATQPETRPDKLTEIGFQTTESSELYFRNVRSYHYLHRQEGGDIFDVYRLKSLYESDMRPLIPFAIYNNWRANEAFIRLDTAYLSHAPFHAVVDSFGRVARPIEMPELYNEAQFDFARMVFRALRDECQLGLVDSGNDTLWLTGDERKATKKVLSDYFRLVGKL